MKIKKTPSDKRINYTYAFTRNDETDNAVTLYPGKDGVTEVDIKYLHALDDAEVYQNLKAAHRYTTPGEKAAMKDWRKSHPGEPEPSSWQLWNAPLSAVCGDEDCSEDKNQLALRAWELSHPEDTSSRVDSVHEFIATLPDYQQKLYRLYFINGLKQSEIADKLGKGRPAISRAIDRLCNSIRENCQ